jgi:FemAB-related protein (PEP-CTERM system-associated)
LLDALEDRTAAGAARAEEPAAPVVRPFRDGDETLWNEFVLSQRDGTFFHLAQWREVLRRAFGHAAHYLLAERDGRICGVLPLAELRSLLFGHALVSTPFCVYGGIVASDQRTHDALTATACALARSLEVDHLEMRNRRRSHPGWPGKDLYVTFRKAIGPDAEQNMQAIPRKQRAMVRKGIKEGLRSEVHRDAARHHATYSESLRNLGTPVFSRRYPELLLEFFGADCEILTVMHGDQAVASCMSFYFRDEVLPYYGGGTFAARGLAGNDFMYWEVMERARQRGSRVFDYGRSKRGTGSYDFKRYWGFEPEQLYYEYFLVKATVVPDLSPVNPRYERMIAAWRHLPLWLTRLAGPPLAKYLG